MRFIKNKYAQHEIVGFVLIVVIVVIIGLFLLVFYLRQEPTISKSANVENFLISSMLCTTDCTLSIEPLDLQDLIKSCYKNDRCTNGIMACDMLRTEIDKIVRESWIKDEKTVNTYSIDIYYEEKTANETITSEEILSLREGNCTGDRTGADNFFHYGKGNIIIAMEICYS